MSEISVKRRGVCGGIQPLKFAAVSGILSLLICNMLLFTMHSNTPDCTVARHKLHRGPQRVRKMWTVMSTQCDPYQDWTVLVAVQSHQRLAIPGPIVRLMACNDEEYDPPQSSYQQFSTVRVHDYNPDYPDDNFSPRNKANNLRDWLMMESGPHDDDVIVLVDPDQIFIRHPNVTTVSHGKAMASYFNLNPNFLRLCNRFCGDECLPFPADEDVEPLLSGPPYIQTAGDFRKHAGLWANLTEKIRLVPELREEFDWLTEMYSYILAALKLGIDHEISNMMITNGEDNGDPWHLARWFAVSKAPLLGLHYCQDYKVGDMSWGKHTYHEFDVRRCDHSAYFPELNRKSLSALKKLRGKPLVQTGAIPQKELDRRRMAWIYENVVPQANAAIRAYYEEFCPSIID